jgi:hypothetical protein
MGNNEAHAVPMLISFICACCGLQNIQRSNGKITGKKWSIALIIFGAFWLLGFITIALSK